MKSKIFKFIMAVVVIVFISGCLQAETQPLSTPAKEPPSLNAYGKLVDISKENDLTVFKIQAEIVNWELNNTLLQVTTNVTDINANIGNNYVFKFFKLHRDAYKKDYWDNVFISQDLSGYKQEGAFKHNGDLFRDQFIATEEGVLDEDISDEKVARAVRIILIVIAPNQETSIQIKIINKQDADIPIKISNLRLVDEYIWEPYLPQCPEGIKSLPQPQPYPKADESLPATPPEPKKGGCPEKSSDERLKEAILTGCIISTDSPQATIPAYSSKIIEFSILCKEPVSCKNWYISNVYGNITTDCSLILIGDFEFTDELGNIHKEENYYLKQHLTMTS